MIKNAIIIISIILLTATGLQAAPPNQALTAKSSATSYLGSSYPVRALNDNNRDTWWEGTKFPDSATLTWTTVQNFNWVTIKLSNSFALCNEVQSLQIETSLDGVTWKIVVPKNSWVFNMIINPNGNLHHFNFGASTGTAIQAKYLRVTGYKNTVVATAPTPTPPFERRAPQIGEIEVYLYGSMPTMPSQQPATNHL